MQPPPIELRRHEDLQIAAYYRWQRRGCPLDEPEIDWFWAEEQLRQQSEQPSDKPTIVAVAEAVGSALGSVAGLAASVGGRIHSESTSRSE